MAAAPGTPRPIVDRLNAESHRDGAARVHKLSQGERQHRHAHHAEGMRQQMADEIANWKQLIAANNIQIQ